MANNSNLIPGNPRGQVPKIPAALHEELYSWHASGLLNTQIRDKLKEEHNIEVSLSTLKRYLSDLKTERKAAAQAAWMEVAKDTAKADIYILNHTIDLLFKKMLEAVDKNDIRLGKELASELHKWTKDRRELCGLNIENPNDNESFEEIRISILKKLGVDE